MLKFIVELLYRSSLWPTYLQCKFYAFAALFVCVHNSQWRSFTNREFKTLFYLSVTLYYCGIAVRILCLSIVLISAYIPLLIRMQARSTAVRSRCDWCGDPRANSPGVHTGRQHALRRLRWVGTGRPRLVRDGAIAAD